MNKIIRFDLLVISIAIVVAIACVAKEPLNDNHSCFRVKCLSYLCGQANFQILDKEYFYLSQMEWNRTANKNEHHVFKTTLFCDDLVSLETKLKPGTMLYAKTVEENTDRTCTRCYALLHGPDTIRYVRLFQGDCK